jgi:glycosyltransferase involved in cell wall biosynthesis
VSPSAFPSLRHPSSKIQNPTLNITASGCPPPPPVRPFNIQNPTFNILHQENSGPGAARNLGASVARGEYLAFLDSDDLWFPWTLETYLEVIEKENRPGFIAGCPFLFERKEQVDAVGNEKLQTTRFADYLQSGEERRWWGVSSFVEKNTLYEKVGGNSGGLILDFHISPGSIFWYPSTQIICQGKPFGPAIC